MSGWPSTTSSGRTRRWTTPPRGCGSSIDLRVRRARPRLVVPDGAGPDRTGEGWVTRKVAANGVVCVDWQKVSVGKHRAGQRCDVLVTDELLQFWVGPDLLKTVARTRPHRSGQEEARRRHRETAITCELECQGSTEVDPSGINRSSSGLRNERESSPAAARARADGDEHEDACASLCVFPPSVAGGRSGCRTLQRCQVRSVAGMAGRDTRPASWRPGGAELVGDHAGGRSTLVEQRGHWVLRRCAS